MRSSSALRSVFCSLVACAACGDQGILSGATGDPCESDLASLCGAQCTTDAQCAGGLHCENQACSAECSASTPCRDGFECTSSGVCEEQMAGSTTGGTNGQGSGSGSSGGQSSGSDCIDITLNFDEVIPNVMLLIDRSGSMNADFPGASNRWEAVKQALIDPADGVVKQLENKVRFGLMLYTSDNGDAGGTCPQIIGGTGIPISLDNYASIAAAYTPEDYLNNGDTPTAESVVAARDMLVAAQAEGPKVIVLATDGEPDTCANADDHSEATNQRSVATVEETYGMGVSLAVIAVGDDVGQDHLQDLANAGAGYAVGGSESAPTYSPENRQGLVEAFASIVDQARSCEVDLSHSVSDPSSGSVKIDGSSLEYDDSDASNGWRLTTPTRLELMGEACNRLKQDASGLEIRFPGCTVVPI